MKIQWIVGVTVVLGALSGCNDADLSLNRGEQSNTSFQISMPARFVNARVVDRNSLTAEIRVNNELIEWPQNTEFSRSFVFSSGDEVDINVVWSETLPDSSKLQLMSYEGSYVITADTTIIISPGDYSPGNFDSDNDGFNNFVERENGTNPLNGDSIPFPVNVQIPRIDPSEAPVIDGKYEIAWDQAQFNDTSGELLYIDNLMIDQGADRPNGSTEFRWFAMHDDTFLYIHVFGPKIELATPVRDSTLFWHDDSVDIFLDGDNSKKQEYDGIDDRHILIPLFPNKDDISPVDNTSVFVLGDNSADVTQFDFSTCICIGDEQRGWEIKIRMADFNIVKGRQFGIDIQLGDDIDGGERDAKWGWFHPSRGTDNIDVDETWRNPSFMGTAIIE